MAQVWKTTKKKPKQLDVKPPPEEAVYLWGYYWEALTDEKLTYSELKAWQDLTGRNCQPWEIDVLFQIDNLRLKVNSDHARRFS